MSGLSKMKRKITILVIEDDYNDRFFVQRIFKKVNSPAELQFAIDGEDAIHYLAGVGKYQDRTQFPLPGLILLDIKMPKVNGFEVLQWLKNQEGLKRLPVTVLSSSTIQSDIDRAYELGANAYLVKPVSYEQLEKVYNRASEFFTVEAAAPVV